MKKRGLSILLILSLCIPMFSTGILRTAAEDNNIEACTHHPEHTEDCGYQEAVEGQPCMHVHSEDCGLLAADEELLCDLDCVDIDEDGAIDHEPDCAYTLYTFTDASELCQHEHDESCGYVEAVEASPCTFVCEICNKTDETGIEEGETQENPAATSEEAPALDVESIKADLLRRVKEGSFDPYSSDMSVDEFYALMELFQEGTLPLKDTTATMPAKVAYAVPIADEPGTDEPGTGGNTVTAVDIPRTMFLFSGLKATDELTTGGGKPLQYPVPNDDSETDAEKAAYPDGLDPYSRGYLRPPTDWNGVTVKKTETGALQTLVVFQGQNNDDYTIAGDVNQELFLKYNGKYVRRVMAQNTEVTVLGAIKLSGQNEYVYYYLASEGQSHDVSTTTLPQGQKFIVEYYSNEHTVNYKVLMDSTDGTDITGETPKETFGDATVNLLGTDVDDTWENIVFGENHPVNTDGGEYSFSAQAPYGYTVEFYVQVAGGTPALQLGKDSQGDFKEVNNGWALGKMPDYKNGSKSNSAILPDTANGPAMQTMSGVIYRSGVTDDRTIIAVVHKNEAPTFLVAPIYKDIANVSGRGCSALTTIGQATNKATDQVEYNIPYDYEDVYLWTQGGNSKYDYSNYGTGDKWAGSGASHGNLKDGNIATNDSWGWSGGDTHPFKDDGVEMTKEDDGTYSYQWTWQTNSGEGGYTLDSLGANGVGVKIPFYSKYVHPNRNTSAGNRWYTETKLPDGATLLVEHLMEFGTQHVYRITVTGARSDVTISAMNLMQGTGAPEFVVYELDGITGATQKGNTNHAEGIQYYNGTTWESGGDALGNTYEGEMIVEEKGLDSTLFKGDMENCHGATFRFKLGDGYDSPGYLWEATKDGVIRDAGGQLQASASRDEDGNFDYGSIAEIRLFSDLGENDIMDSQHIYKGDDGWYYIRVTTQGGYRIALLTIVARPVRYVVRYVPSYEYVKDHSGDVMGDPSKGERYGTNVGVVDDPENMPTFVHDGEHDSFKWETPNDIPGKQYDTANGNYYDTAVDMVIQVATEVPRDPGNGDKDYRFVDWVLLDSDYNPIWTWTNQNGKTVQVTTDKRGYRILVTPNGTLPDDHHPALWDANNNQLIIGEEYVVHWNGESYDLGKNGTYEVPEEWVLLTEDGHLAYAKTGSLVELPANTDLADLLTGWSVRDADGNAAPISETSELHFRNTYITLADVNQYAVANDGLGGDAVDIYVLRLMPVWEVVDNPFHYTVALNWVDADGNVTAEYFSDLWNEVLTNWELGNGFLTVFVNKDATPFQDWIAQHPTYTFWDEVNNNSAYYDKDNKLKEENPDLEDGERHKQAEEAMEAEMAKAIADYLPNVFEGTPAYQKVLNALARRDVGGLRYEQDNDGNYVLDKDGNKIPLRDDDGNLITRWDGETKEEQGNGEFDFLRMGGYAYQVREDWGTIVIWMYETKGGLIFHNAVEPAAYLGDEEDFYYTIHNATVTMNSGGTGSGNQGGNTDPEEPKDPEEPEATAEGEEPSTGGSAKTQPLKGVYKAYPEKVYDDNGKERDLLDADAWLVDFREGDIYSIVKNDGSPEPTEDDRVTYFTLKDGEGIMLYVPEGHYEVTELGTKSGGTYSVTTTYTVGGNEQEAKDGWELIDKDNPVSLQGSRTRLDPNASQYQAGVKLEFEVGEKNVVQTITFVNRTAVLYIENDLIAPSGHELWDETWNYKVNLTVPAEAEPSKDESGKSYYNINIFNLKSKVPEKTWTFDSTARLYVTAEDEQATDTKLWSGTLQLKPHQRVALVIPAVITPEPKPGEPDSEIRTLAARAVEDANSGKATLGTYVIEQNEPDPNNGDVWMLQTKDVAGKGYERQGDLSMDTPPVEEYVNLINDTGIIITKLVSSAAGRTDDTVFNFELQLDDTSINGTFGDLTFTNGLATFSLKDGKSVSAIFANNPHPLTYTLKETAATGGYDLSRYTTSWSNSSGAVEKSPDSSREYKGTLIDGMLTDTQCINTYKEHDLTISKTVTGKDGEKTRDFNFVITLAMPSDVIWPQGGYTWTKSDGTTGTVNSTNATDLSFTLRHDQSITFKDLPEGTTYTVRETDENRYGYLTVIEGEADETLEEDTIVRFINRKPAGGLAISKDVVSPEPGDKDDKVFEFLVQFISPPNPNNLDVTTGLEYTVAHADGTSEEGTMDLIQNGSTYTGTIHLKHGDVLQFKDVFPNAKVKVTETEVYGFELKDPIVTAATLDEEGEVTSEEKVTLTDEVLEFNEGGTLYTFAFTNTRITHDLTIDKTVKGNVGERDKDFTFTINATDKGEGENAGKPLAGTYAYEITGNPQSNGSLTFVNGKVTVQLRHGQHITINGLPEGATWTVTEDDYSANGYTTEVQVDDGTPESDRTAEGLLEEDMEVHFTNTRTASVPTDATTEYLWLIVILLLGAGGLIWFAWKKRRRHWR